MTTTMTNYKLIATFGGYRVYEDREWHTAPAEYTRYDLLNADGDSMYSDDDLGEITKIAREMQAELEAEEKAERIGEIQDKITTKLWDCEDEETLAKILALLQ